MHPIHSAVDAPASQRRNGHKAHGLTSRNGDSPSEPPNGAQIVTMSDVQPERVRYLRPGVPLGMLTIVGGNGGLGKSMLTQLWAAETSRGDLLSAPADCMLLSGEDTAGVIRGRLEAANADLRRCHTLKLRRKGEEVGITLPDDLERIERRIEELSVRLLVIDPINAFFPGNVDYFRDTDVRSVLGPIARMAERHDLAGVVIAHLTKAQTSEALHRIGGSAAYGNAVRSGFVFDRNPDDPDGEQGEERVLAHAKSNVGKREPSLLYRIVPVVIHGDIETARLEEIGESDLGANELFARNASHSPSEKPRDRVAGALRIVLGDGEPHDRAAVIAKVIELTDASERTIKRAASELDVVSDRTGFPAKATWMAPDSWAKPSGPTERGPTGPTGKSPAKATIRANRSPQLDQSQSVAQLDGNGRTPNRLKARNEGDK